MEEKQLQEITIGSMPISPENVSNNVTFCLTENCNLRCKYCYEVHKNNKKKMTFDVAKKAVDIVLLRQDIYDKKSIVWEFFGGEPLLEIDLADEISEYIKEKQIKDNHCWKDKYIFHFSTNGILYDSPKFQNYLRKNEGHVSVGISVDGNKIKHNTQRIYPDGRGSYDDVIKNVKLWKKQFPNASTKATFSHEDLPYLKDSVIDLWNIGVKKVMANIVLEDVWDENDPQIFEEQLKELADYIITHKIWKDPEYMVRFFDPAVGLPLRKIDLLKRYCGAGKMLAISCDGEFYPCIRFLNFTLSNHKGYCIGSIYDGINEDKLKAFNYLIRKNIKPNSCNDCEVASGCMNCVGGSYDFSEEGTIFSRTKYICEMHKANVRAINYFWDKLDPYIKGYVNPRKEFKERINMSNIKHLLLYIDSSEKPYCLPEEIKRVGKPEKMSDDLIKAALEFAKKHNFKPLFYNKYQISNIFNPNIKTDNILISVKELKNLPGEYLAKVVNLLINKNDIKNMFAGIKYLMENGVGRINLMLIGIKDWTDGDLLIYSEQLTQVALFIKENELPTIINVLHDVTVSERFYYGCDAGVNTFTLAPNGKLYICPAFYLQDPKKYSIGDLKDGFTFQYQESLINSDFPECKTCRHYQCKRCLFLNKMLTNEYSVSPDIQCKISNLEAKVAAKFFKKQIIF